MGIYKLLCSTALFMLIPLTVNSEAAYYEMTDEVSGQIVYVTGWKVRLGDEFLTADNRRYQITAINGRHADAHYIGNVDLAEIMPVNYQTSGAVYAEDKKKVAIYHTHNDEAYLPSEGVESSEQGTGGILKVGDAFAQALENNGIEAVHSTTSHIPHDDMAYERSRRTAMQLIKNAPDAVFDVHRDATPPEAYQTEIAGENVTRVQLVVGKYGPTGKQIEEYALKMKAEADKQYPGLVKGIFFAKGGDYNQDLHPKSMLLEVGAHTNELAQAERGIALFANTVPAVLNITSANASNIEGAADVGTEDAGASGSMKSLWYILLFAVGGAVIYLFLSTGSLKGAKNKAEHLVKEEFNDVLSGSKKKFSKKSPEKQKK